MATSRCSRGARAISAQVTCLCIALWGRAGNRLIALGTVTSGPEPSGHDRWPWQVHRHLTDIVSSVGVAPGITDIGETPAGLRVMKKISREHGQRAVELVSAAAG